MTWGPRRPSPPPDPATAADPDLDDNWTGGHYELAVNLGPSSDDARIDAAVAAVEEVAGVRRDPHRPLSRLNAAGVTTCPSGDVVCGISVVQEGEGGDDWVFLFVPLGALEKRDPRVGAYPFGHDGGAVSRGWREPLDAWLLDLGRALFTRVRFAYAFAGFETSGESLEELTGDVRHHPVLVRDGETLRHLPLTHWSYDDRG